MNHRRVAIVFGVHLKPTPALCVAGGTIACGNVSAINAVEADPGTVAGVTNAKAGVTRQKEP